MSNKENIPASQKPTFTEGNIRWQDKGVVGQPSVKPTGAPPRPTKTLIKRIEVDGEALVCVAPWLWDQINRWEGLSDKVAVRGAWKSIICQLRNCFADESLEHGERLLEELVAVLSAAPEPQNEQSDSIPATYKQIKSIHADLQEHAIRIADLEDTVGQAPSPPAIDVEALKREADENGARTVYFSDRGWNACIDHLASKYDFVPKGSCLRAPLTKIEVNEK